MHTSTISERLVAARSRSRSASHASGAATSGSSVRKPSLPPTTGSGRDASRAEAPGAAAASPSGDAPSPARPAVAARASTTAATESRTHVLAASERP